MANKRILKKQVMHVCGDLASECIFASEYIPGIDVEKMSQLVCKIALLQQATIEKINFSFDKSPADFESLNLYNKAHNAYCRQAYNSLKESFNNHVKEIVKEMNALLPDAARELNKQVAK